MHRVLAAALALFLAQPASAATTWALITSTPGTWIGQKSVTATCTTGTENAPSGVGTAAAPVGIALQGVRGYQVVVEAVTDAATVNGGHLRAYFYDESGTDWVRIPDLDLVVPATAVHGYSFLGSAPGIGQPVIAGAWGRIAYVPDTVTISAGSLVVRILVTGTGGDKL